MSVHTILQTFVLLLAVPVVGLAQAGPVDPGTTGPAWSPYLVGGLMAFGARMAGGCTSGHGISGALQLSVGSWMALIAFFVGGAATAMLMFYL